MSWRWPFHWFRVCADCGHNATAHSWVWSATGKCFYGIFTARPCMCPGWLTEQRAGGEP